MTPPLAARSQACRNVVAVARALRHVRGAEAAGQAAHVLVYVGAAVVDAV